MKYRTLSTDVNARDRAAAHVVVKQKMGNSKDKTLEECAAESRQH